MATGNHKNKHILLVRSGYPSKKAVLKKLQSLGYYVIILDKDKNCPEELADDWVTADLSSKKDCIKAIEKYLSKPGNYINGALTFWEEAVVLTAEITDYFGWIGISSKVAKQIKNKYSFRTTCRQNNLPVPRHAVLSSEDDLENIKNKLSFPVVIKPIYGAASAFVMKADSSNQLKSEYESIQKYIKTFWLTPEWYDTSVYVEEYIDGQEVDIDILLQNGKLKFYSITDNFSTNEPYFVETGQAIPSSLSKSRQNDLIKMATKVLNKLNVKNGCIHFEAKSSSKGPIPIEINLRMGGDEVYSFIEHAWGVNLVEYAAKIALGEEFEIVKPKKPHVYLEGRYYLPTREGKIKEILIEKCVEKDPHVLEVNLVKKKNEKALMPPKDFDYLGWITAFGKTSKSAHSHLESNYSHVKFIIR